jgi:hypothetical protein
LKDVAMSVEKSNLPYERRSKFIAENFNMSDSVLCDMITGEIPGQILLNFDEMPEDSLAD